ncbi:GNAT family N-acetyltransferase [Paenibacillus prosopidis]|uniref:Ribosomal protein S18 acetylase RimI-like enzyme n=1 Tax=Paenibacillus prosopidis TaxID=630520 RepID=A0A368VH33_9BACL|nr:GNAT family N-acetyltransferase [Paenibacillus prosopidis]RCW40639.1 ribosomal protein S18 acetylase RimI-like enzyme [Paenibacillus prosopidis]
MIEIRWAKLEDAQDLGFVHSESYRAAYKGIIPDEYLNQCTPIVRERYFYKALIQGTEQIAIMLVDNKAVGCMILKACSDIDLQQCGGEISAIYLLQNYRGMGLGKHLLNWGIDKFKELGYGIAFLWVLKDNKNAIRFYEYQHFLCDGTERQIYRGRNLIQIRYQKTLI